MSGLSVLLVEDTPEQAELYCGAIEAAFPDSRIGLISTESEFRAHLDDIERTPPDLVVLDVMLRWADPSPDMPPRPEDVRIEGYFKAGLRCKALLEAREKTRGIPIILYSVLERTDLGSLPQTVLFLSKETQLEQLIDSVRVLRRRR